MQAIDLAIVGLYVLSTIAIGLLARRRAARSLQSYFLADKSLPWYMLGLSNASDMYDVTGTMWLVTLCVVYGLKSVWIPWVWPVFNQIFLMVYLSCWLRRSNALTGAEWIATRFGEGTGGQLSQFVVIGFAVLSVLGFLAYGFVGIGKFIEIFLPWSAVAPYAPFEIAPHNVANLYGIVFTTITMIYAVLGGMFSIVWTDVLKFVLMTIVSVVVAILASYTALDLATRISASRDQARRFWLAGGACSMGPGIFSMHVVGMPITVKANRVFKRIRIVVESWLTSLANALS